MNKVTVTSEKRLMVLIVIGLIGGLASCQPTSKTDDLRLADVQQRLDQMDVDLRSKEVSIKVLENEKLEKARELNLLKSKLEEAEKERDNFHEILKKLEREFSEYKKNYQLSVAKRIQGYPLAGTAVGGKAYDKASLLKVEGETASITHSGGVVRVEISDLPESLRRDLAINQDTVVHTEVLSLLKRLEDRQFSSSQVAQGVRETQSIPSEKTNQLTEVSLDHDLAEVALKSVATVNSGNGNGSGFIARQGKATYFYTNFHVIDGATSLTAVLTGGEMLKLPDEVEIADEVDAFDLVRFRVSPKSATPVLEIADSSDFVKMGDGITALGNSGGAGVVPVLNGRIKAIGPYAIEVDAEVIQGNSGGPVVRTGSNTVLGVVTRALNQGVSGGFVTKGTQFDAVRRICLRPEQIKRWRPALLSRLVEEPKIISQIATDNEVLAKLKGVRFTPKGIAGIDSDSLLSGGRSNIGASIAQSIRSTNAYLDRGKTRVAVATAKDYCQRFIKTVGRLYGANVEGVQPESYSRFNREEFKLVAEARRAICNDINQHFASEITKLWQWAPK